jgi:hypothetical protein
VENRFEDLHEQNQQAKIRYKTDKKLININPSLSTMGSFPSPPEEKTDIFP